MQRGEIIRYVDMTIAEGMNLQRGMNYNVQGKAYHINASQYIFPNIFLTHSTSSAKIPTHHDPKPTSYTPLQQARTSYTTHRHRVQRA